MKTEDFFTLLKTHNEKTLLFEYAKGHKVKANYHITEVKNVQIDAVDCGGKTDFWKETVVQLWENPLEKHRKKALDVSKALSIFNRVQSMKPIDYSTEIKFEYGNDNFHTAQLNVAGYRLKTDALIIELTTDKTLCKAAKPERILENAVPAGCGPNSNCCS